jgi:NADH-quinone oxidoreductase subunit D
MSELTRLSSHLVWLGTSGIELGAMTMLMYCFRERDTILDMNEEISGFRMHTSYIRPGGVMADATPRFLEMVDAFCDKMPSNIDAYEDMLTMNPIWRTRTMGIGRLSAEDAKVLGATGPMLRGSGVAWDLRKSMPYSGYENYDFDVVTENEGDNYARYLVRINEMRQSLRIVEQCLDRLQPGPVMVADRKIAWPAQLANGGDGMGNSLEHIREIMGQSMEALIHHFKLVTEGFRVPPGQAYAAVESPKGELGVHAVSDGGTRPFRVHYRDPSFTNLQAMAAMCEGGQVADVIVAVASIDPVMGGVDR